MAGENDFLPFATSSGANVESQASYSSDPAVGTGETNGLANAQRANKVWRQASSIAAMIGTFIANANLNAVDNGNINQLELAFVAALQSFIENTLIEWTPGNPLVLQLAGYYFIFGFGPTLAPTVDTINVPLGVTLPNAFLWAMIGDTGASCWAYGINQIMGNLSAVQIWCNINQVQPDAFGGNGTHARQGFATPWWLVVGK